jgi:hypothetical protein
MSKPVSPAQDTVHALIETRGAVTLSLDPTTGRFRAEVFGALARGDTALNALTALAAQCAVPETVETPPTD